MLPPCYRWILSLSEDPGTVPPDTRLKACSLWEWSHFSNFLAFCTDQGISSNFEAINEDINEESSHAYQEERREFPCTGFSNSAPSLRPPRSPPPCHGLRYNPPEALETSFYPSPRQIRMPPNQGASHFCTWPLLYLATSAATAAGHFCGRWAEAL
jgi:hypothetical protein